MTLASKVDLELSRVLVSSAIAERSGIVSTHRGKHRRLFCLEKGVLVFAASNVIEEQFTEFLLEQKRITAAELDSARAKNADTDSKLSRTLVDEGIVEEALLEQTLGDHLRNLLYLTLDWPDGEATLQHGSPDLGDEVTTELPCIPSILAYAAEHPPDLADLRDRVERLALGLRVSGEAAKILEHGALPPSMAELLASIDGPMPVEELVRNSFDGDGSVWRSLYGLLLIGALEPTDPGKTEAKSTEKLTREEVLSRIEQADLSDHYRLLRVSPNSSRDEIRQAYYLVARKYHPDRFRTGPLQELREKMETYFAQVTEAYNTLYNPALRAAYDRDQADESPAEAKQDTASIARENFKRGQALVARGRLAEAVSWLENAVQQDASNAGYRLELGKVMSRNPRFRRQAEEHLIEANRLDPSMTLGYVALGDLYLKQGDRKNAARLFREALRWEPGHLEATEKLASLG